MFVWSSKLELAGFASRRSRDVCPVNSWRRPVRYPQNPVYAMPMPVALRLDDGIVDLIQRVAKVLVPNSWQNIEAKFSITEVDLHFLADAKSSGLVRVWVFDGAAQEAAYLEGPNTPTATVQIGSNRRSFSDLYIVLLFQLARCAREFSRTSQIKFKRDFERHRLALIQHANQKNELRMYDDIAERTKHNSRGPDSQRSASGVIFVSDFGVSIPEATICDDGPYFVLDHGQHYTVDLFNNGKLDADADLFIDGEYLGKFRVNAGSSFRLEHPSKDDGKFTFYLLDSEEGQSIGLKASPSLGLVQVCFQPEHRLVRESDRLAVEQRKGSEFDERLREAKSLLLRLRRSDGSFPPDREVAEFIETGLTRRFGSVSPPHSRALCAGSGIMPDDDGIDQPLFAGNSRAPDPEPFSGVLRAGEGIDPEPFSGLPEKSPSRDLPAPGGTGLSGKSDQEYVTVEGLIVDFDGEVVISLRLGGRRRDINRPRPLRGSGGSNPVPPPLT